MKRSTARCATTFNRDVSDVVVPSTEVSTSTCHCHYPSNRVAREDTVATFSLASFASSTARCDLCERLRGRSGRRGRSYAMRIEFDILAVGSRFDYSRPRCENRPSSSAANDSRAIHQRHDRTSKCDRVPPCESSARCVSSVVRWNPLVERIAGKSTPWRRKLLSTIVFLLLIVPGLVAQEQNTDIGPSKKDGVCQSIDIRNKVENLSALEGCRVVEGFVQIVLIENQSDFDKYTFPELVEITGYLVLYRVNGLKSIGHLFPNLAVIHGQSLFFNHALVAFEMMTLQEIGLHSLTNILRGSVRFENNPMLCYVDTIDWDLIGKAGKGEHVISGNKITNACPVCDKSCSVRSTKPDETLCWNRQHCQQICEKCGDGACDGDGACCHPFCLGGCTGPTTKDCIVCGKVLESGVCKDSCSNETFVFMNRRCVKEQECRLIKRPPEKPHIDGDEKYPYKPYLGKCAIECPLNFTGIKFSNGSLSCIRCNGPCMKECPSAIVESISTAEQLRGCTHIKGSLVIQIRGGKNIVKELEKSLNMIEEIHGYLKVIRSFPLVSLNFLKSLRLIRGNTLESEKYTLSVLDNQNLQELWNWVNRTNITILSNSQKPGKIFFHLNPKLCLHKIEDLRVRSNLTNFTEAEVASNSNGDKVACNITMLKAWVTRKASKAVIIEWEPFMHHDARSLLGYVIYYLETPYQNVSIYEGRDACSDNWRAEDIAPEGMITNSTNSTRVQPSPLSFIITVLKPNTQYAYYVKTYTIATEKFGGQSEVKYFTTNPDAPSSPRALSIYSNSSSELVISWSPPLFKNGNLTHYLIVGHWERDDKNFIDQRNYCDEPMSLPEKKLMSDAEEEKLAEKKKESAELSETNSCDCTDRNTDERSMREKEVSSSIDFENALHNHVYVKRVPTNSRRRRHVDEMSIATEEAKNLNSQNEKSSINKTGNGTPPPFEIQVPSTNLTYVIRKLRHFSVYNIEIEACREPIEHDNRDNCSMKSMKTFRTLALEGADDIPPNTFRLSRSGENNSLSMVTLMWDEPREPNGLIITYQIEYKRIDIKNIQPTVVCITRRDFTNAGNLYLLKDLPAGNYSVKVRATSLAGNGAYTEVQYFLIEEYKTLGTQWIILLTFFCIVIVIGISFLARCLYTRKSMRNVPSMRLIATVNPEYVSSVYAPDEWEVPRKKILLLRELGNGSFGMVYEGVAKDIVEGKPEVPCAVKTVNENATDRQRIEFLNEASVMKTFSTYHVVKLLGVVSQSQPTLVVMELMVNGDLKTYLRSHRPDVCENFPRQPPTLKRILQMAIEIADGMAYLATNKFVHRDLAARNCMVAEDLTVKIGDFGMTRDIYETDYYRKGTKGLLPVRWMAPESLKDGVFTSFSDVWSYGIVLWEMVTLASQPYQGLSNDQVLRYVIEGGVMERPENCPDSLYNLMRYTWSHKSTKRPTFIDIATILLQEVDVEAFERVSFYHSLAGIEARNLNDSPQNKKDLEMAALQDLREEEVEGEEDSPLRQDFGDFASFEPISIKDNLSPRYGADSYGENSKATPNFHDINSSKVPLKAGFDDFDGVSGNSLASSKDTLNLPFVEDSLKSVKSSPFIRNKSTSRGSVSQTSLGKSASPQSLFKRNFFDSPHHPSKSRASSDYENRSPQIMSSVEKKTPLHVDFPSMDAIDIDISSEKNNSKNANDYMNKPEKLNNGYIGNTTT